MTKNGETLIHLEGIKKVFYTDEVETHALAEIHRRLAVVGADHQQPQRFRPGCKSHAAVLPVYSRSKRGLVPVSRPPAASRPSVIPAPSRVRKSWKDGKRRFAASIENTTIRNPAIVK